IGDELEDSEVKMMLMAMELGEIIELELRNAIDKDIKLIDKSSVKIGNTNAKVNKVDDTKSYVSALNKNVLDTDNKLFLVPTRMDDKGDEVVVFNEELVREGCKKWENTACGYFIRCSSVPVYEVKYNLKRMWGRHGLKEIIVDGEGIRFVKFRSNEGLDFVVDQSPWMVNEAWSTKGISTLSSRLRRPIMMDQMTVDMCHKGTGRLGFARVLVETEATKGLPKSIEISYVDEQFNCLDQLIKWRKLRLELVLIKEMMGLKK
ncbi:hypothetical protein Tco_1395450, partial [Tanacetum coccineum]